MFNINKYSAYLLIALTTLVNVNAWAQTPNKAEKIEVKCYVKLQGAGNTIAFWKIKEQSLSSFAQQIVGTTVDATSVGKDKANIEKVYECALLNKRFSTSAANRYDAVTPR